MKPRYPIKKYQGKFETWLNVLYGRKSMTYHSKFLDQFFRHFPDNSSLESFGPLDIYEYKKWREASGASYGTILQEIKAVRRFFKWTIEDQELPLSNPVKLFKGRPSEKIVRRKKDSLRLEEYKRLLEAIKDEPKLKSTIVRIVLGMKIPDIRPLHQMFRRRMIQAGMPHVTFGFVRKSMRNGLWREIIKNWQDTIFTEFGDSETCDALLQDTKLGGDAFGDIKITAPDVRPAINTSSDNEFPVDGICNQQESAEPQGS